MGRGDREGRQHQMRSAHGKLGMAIIASCLSFPTGLWRSKRFLWGSCRPPGKLRRRGAVGRGYMALSPPQGLGRGEMGP